jgi:purine-binding chemotaxis protein CheW
MTEFLEEIQVRQTAQSSLGQKYLSFSFALEKYAIELQYVQEILMMQSITRIPHAPEFVVGVINLRGHILPVLDPRPLLGMDLKEVDERDCIILTRLKVGDSIHTWGLLVEKVADVLSIQEAQIDQNYSGGLEIKEDFISGIAKINNQVLILVDPNRLIPQNIVQQLKQIQEQPTHN